MRYAAWLLLILVVSVSRTLAQGGDCPAIVDAALQTAADACTALSRNQACYGNVRLDAVPQAGASFTFEQTGDLINLADVASLNLSAMTEDSWGVALLLLQANLPDTLPGQNVTMVLFGEVAIASAVPTEPVVEPTPEPRPIVFIVTADSTINVRSGPSTSDAVVASLGAGETVPTDGRSDDGTWLHVRFDDGTTGWIFAELVSVDGDISLLPVTDGNTPVVEATEEIPAEPAYTPMQAFYFHSSIGDSGCQEAPDSGILIQTPQGAGTINLVVNEVEITLGSTAYMTAGDGEMTVSLIEGQGTVSAFGVTVTLPAGTRARIPLDANGAASGAPIGPEPYAAASVSALPVALLPQTVTAATPLTEDEIAAIGLQEGNWVFSYVYSNCVETYSFTVPVLYDADQRDYPFVLFDFSVLDSIGWLQTITSAAFAEGVQVPGEYHVETGGYIFDVMVVSSTYIEGSGTFPDAACTYTYDFTLTAGEMPETGALQEGIWTLTGSYTSDCPTEPIDFTLNLSVSGNVFTGPDNGIDYRVYSQVEIINQAIQSGSVNVPGNYVSESGDESYARAIDLNIVSTTRIEMTILDSLALGSINCTENYTLLYTANE